MTGSLIFATLAVLMQYDAVFAQEAQVPSTLTAAELWNPSTWFYPYAIASAEGYRDYYMKAQKATNELYKQIYATNAFPWITGNWGQPQNNQQNQQNQQNNQQGGNNQAQKPEGEKNPPKENDKPEEAPAKEEEAPAKEEEKPQNDVNAEVQNGDAGAQVQGNTQDGTADAQVDDGQKEEDAEA